MTIVVYRDGIMAADTASWKNDHVFGYHQKVKKSPDGWLLGCTGELHDILQYEAWFMAGREEPCPKLRGDMTAIMVSPDTAITIRDSGYKMSPYTITEPWAHIGQGPGFALGCLAAGASAEETVRLALIHVPYVGGDVCTERLHSLAPPVKLKRPKRK